MKRILSSFVLAAALALPVHAQPAAPADALTIVSGDKTHVFQVELVNAKDAPPKGLAGRDALAKDHGLLLDYRGGKDDPNITMKNVKFDLDMLFVDSAGTIVAIVTGCRAGSWRPIAPGLRAGAVLQIAAGEAAAQGLKPGDTVKYKIFVTPNGG